MYWLEFDSWQGQGFLCHHVHTNSGVHTVLYEQLAAIILDIKWSDHEIYHPPPLPSTNMIITSGALPPTSLEWNPNFRFIFEAVDFSTKLRKTLNGNNLTPGLMTYGHIKWGKTLSRRFNGGCIAYDFTVWCLGTGPL